MCMPLQKEPFLALFAGCLFPALSDVYSSPLTIVKSLAITPRLSKAAYKILIVRELFARYLFPTLPNAYPWLCEMLIPRLSISLSLAIIPGHSEASF